jgi:hypothetical protein
MGLLQSTAPVPIASSSSTNIYQQHPLNAMNPFADFGGLMEPFNTTTASTASSICHSSQFSSPNFGYGHSSVTSTILDSSIPPFLEFSAEEVPTMPPKYVYGLDEFNKPYNRPFISDKPRKFKAMQFFGIVVPKNF